MSEPIAGSALAGSATILMFIAATLLELAIAAGPFAPARARQASRCASPQGFGATA